jgi:hypothetical protein
VTTDAVKAQSGPGNGGGDKRDDWNRKGRGPGQGHGVVMRADRKEAWRPVCLARSSRGRRLERIC